MKVRLAPDAFTANVRSLFTAGLLIAASLITGQNAHAQATGTNTDNSAGQGELPFEPLGPCSRRTQLVISEIMYKPVPRTDKINLEFIEIYNSNPWGEDIGGYQLAGPVQFQFPPHTIIQSNAFLVVAAAPADLQTVQGVTNVMGPYTGSLKKNGTIQLLDNHGAIFLEIPYASTLPWPAGALGTGHSIVLARPSYGEADPRAWALSEALGGSPGQPENYLSNPLRKVVINEYLLHHDDIQPGYVELYNHSTVAVDMSGCVLTDDASTNKYIFPNQVMIAAGGYLAFDLNDLGFITNPAGGLLLLKAPNGGRVLDAVSYEPQALNISSGRWPDGADEIYPLANLTPAGPNDNILIRDIVINEIMYKPMSNNDDDQYVELFNKGTNSMNLGGWQFVAGIRFTFPTNTVINAGGYLVVARNMTNLLAHYTNLNSSIIVGNYSGKLPHGGGRLALAMSSSLVQTNIIGVVLTNTIYVVEDEVTYATGGRWGKWADGGGSSLELINPNTNHRLGSNWTDSDERAKAPWINLEFTGVLDNASGYNGGPVDLVQIGLLGEGECLMDNIEVIPGKTGPNYVSNSTFETGIGNWIMQGDHIRSSLETNGGYASQQCLHIRASDGIWTGANSVQSPLLNTSLQSGQTATLRLKARWLCGWPEVLMRLHGNGIELTGSLPLPPNPGTPGSFNSRALANPGPAIFAVRHTPSIPPARQPVVITARFHDADSFKASLLYRIDNGINPNPTYTTVPMVDDGTGGDVISGDGIYSATIPAQVPNVVVAFLIMAQNSSGATTIFPADIKDNSGLPRECVFMFGDSVPKGSFGHYHLWMTQNWINRWGSLPGLSNENHDGTLVDGGGRIIYNMVGRFAGSPYHQYSGSPVTTIGGMHWTLPDDDKFLGSSSFNKQHVPGNGPLDDTTLQREQTSFWMARQLGLPWNYRRYYILYVNGTRHGPLMEDCQVPGGDLLKEYWPNDNNGFLYKNNAWFEFDASGQGFSNNSWCTLNRFLTTGGIHKLARYRWNYWIRQTPDSANNFTNVYNLVDAANTPISNFNYYNNLEALVDTEEFMRMSAIEHATGDWDSFTAQNQWNMYCYKPLSGKWTLLKWDWNISLGNSGSWGPGGGNLFTISGADTPMNTFQNAPAYRRAYLRAFKDLADGPMNNANVNPILDAKYAAFVANGLTTTAFNGVIVASPAASGLKNWIGTMHNSLLVALTNQGMANVPFTVRGPQSITTGGNVVQLIGTAPVEVKTIDVNGISYPVTWGTLKDWVLMLPLNEVTNFLTIQGRNVEGQILSNMLVNISITVTNPLVAPQDALVISEIMYHPSVPNAEYVEIHNHSSFSFDLSNYRVDGLGFTFAGGATISPNGYIVAAKNLAVFSATYGAKIPAVGPFTGKLNNGGERLALIKPGSTPADDLIIDQVRYDNKLPWPMQADGQGCSLQLVDATQDNSRVGNWSTSATNSLVRYTPGSANSVEASIPAFPSVRINEVEPNNVNGPTNLSGEHSPWIELYNSGTNAVDLTGYFLSDNYTNLSQWSFPSNAVVGAGQFLLVWMDGKTNNITHGEYHTSFRIDPANGSVAFSRMQSGIPAVMDYADYTDMLPDHSFGAYPDGQSIDRQVFTYPTPGATNNPAMDSTPVVINEWMASNSSILIDPVTQSYEDWFELYNAGTNTVDLRDYKLVSSLGNTNGFRIPAGFSIPPQGFLLVWADKSSAQDPANYAELHVDFNLSAQGDGIALYNPIGGLVDEVNFSAQTNDVSQGRWPDGDTGLVYYFMPDPTPNASNQIPGGRPGPVLNPISNQVDNEGVLLTFTATATSQDTNTTLRFSLDPGAPLFAAIDALTGVFQWTPSEAQGPGVYYVTVRVSDNGTPNMSSARRFKLTVNEVNTPPTLDFIPDQVVNEGALLVLTPVANDSDLPPQRLTFSLDTGAPEGMQINTTNGTISWRPSEAQGPGLYTAIVRVADDINPPGSANRSFNIQVREVNTPPVMSPIMTQRVYGTLPLNFQVSASDPDLPVQQLTYFLASGAPAGATLDSATGIFSWTPTTNQFPGNYSITIGVMDDGQPPLSAMETVLIFAYELNHPPVLSIITNQIVDELATLHLQLHASDPDAGQALNYSLAPGAPLGLALDTQSGHITWTPAENQGPGTFDVTVSVSDNGEPVLSASQSFKITVRDVNSPPKIKLIPNQAINLGQTLSLNVQATDSDIPTNSVSFSLDPGAPAGAVLSSNGAFTWTPTKSQAPGTNWFTVRATDNGIPSLSDTQTFYVIVNIGQTWQYVQATGVYAGATPYLYLYMDSPGDLFLDDIKVVDGSVADTGTNYVVNGGFEIPQISPWIVSPNLVNSSITNSPSHGGTHSLHLVSSSAGTTRTSSIYQTVDGLVNGNTYTLSFWHSAGTGGNLIVRFSGSWISITLPVIFTPVNTPPVIDSIASQKVTAGQTLSLLFTASDSDIPAQALTFSLDPGAPATASLTAGGQFTWTSSPQEPASTNLITVRVTDSGSPAQSETRSFTVIVAPRPLPTSIAIKSIEPLSEGTFEIRWLSEPGFTYRVWSRDDLITGEWLLLDETVPQTTESVFNDPTPAARRFYRISVSP